MTDPKELDRLADDGCPNHPEPDEFFDDRGEDMECPFCGGSGRVTSRSGINRRITMDCPECGGTGWF